MVYPGNRDWFWKFQMIQPSHITYVRYAKGGWRGPSHARRTRLVPFRPRFMHVTRGVGLQEGQIASPHREGRL